MKALLFPGQGSQIVGMGLEFYNKFEIVKNIFDEADEKLGFKISKIILEGPETDLKLTKNTQPAILIVSYSIYSVLKKDFGLKEEDINYIVVKIATNERMITSWSRYDTLQKNLIAFKIALYFKYTRIANLVLQIDETLS